MNLPDNHDDLERRLREAFAAKADRIGPDDLDLDREEAVAEQLRAMSAPHRGRRIVAGVGILAAAAAAVGVVALAIHPIDQQATNAGRPATTAATSTIGPGSSTGAPSSPAGTDAVPDGTRTSAQQPLNTGAGSSQGSSAMSPATPGGAATGHDHSPLSGSSIPATETLPPTMPTGLPQDGTLGTGEYAGAIPLASTDGGVTRMLSMPDATKWQVTSRADRSMTVRITYLSTDLEAYWSRTLPSQGWRPTATGWHFPGTAYDVSPITDKGSFTVSW